jgi:2-keto-4-pentenoate hydratase
MQVGEAAMSVRDAGQALAAARRRRTGIDDLPGGLPADEATAYAVQRAAAEAYGAARAGYKIGATNPMAQSLLNTDHPFHAPLFVPDCHGTGAVLTEPGHGLLGLEPEFALRLGSDLPARPEPYALDEIEAAVAAVHPAFEVIGLRLPAALFTRICVTIADFGANVAFVAGDGLEGWRHHDLAAVAVDVTVDGKKVASGAGANVLGHPLKALLWLANDLRASGAGLAKGDWISTGTCAGVIKIERGQRAVAAFGPCGEVSLALDG